VEQGTIVSSPAKDGVIIKRFSFDSSTINEEDTVGLNLEIQNVGEVKATVEDITLFGPDLSEWSVSGPTPSIKVDLLPSVPEVDFEGEARSTRWKLKAPDITAETNYNFGTRIVYSYSTVYTGTLRVVDEKYLETLPEGERSSLLESSGVFSSSITGGPLTVKPMKGRNFIVSGEGGTSQLVFELSNVGSGYPASASTINQNTMYNVEISSSSGLTNCKSYGSTTARLSKGKSRLFSCNFDIPTNVVNKQDIIFSITFNYHYYVDGMASITVEPSGLIGPGGTTVPTTIEVCTGTNTHSCGYERSDCWLDPCCKWDEESATCVTKSCSGISESSCASCGCTLGPTSTTTTIWGCVVAGYSCRTDETDCDNWCSQKGYNGECIAEECPPSNNCCCRCYGIF